MDSRACSQDKGKPALAKFAFRTALGGRRKTGPHREPRPELASARGGPREFGRRQDRVQDQVPLIVLSLRVGRMLARGRRGPVHQVIHDDDDDDDDDDND